MEYKGLEKEREVRLVGLGKRVMVKDNMWKEVGIFYFKVVFFFGICILISLCLF